MEDRQAKIQKEFSLKSGIFNLLNDFGEMVIEDYYPLKVTEEDFFVLFELIKEQFKYIKESIDFNAPGTFGNLVTFAFKALFIGENDIKIDNIEQNMEYFELILIYSVEKNIEPIKLNLMAFINNLTENNKSKKFLGNKIITLFNEIFTNSITFFIYLLIINNDPVLLELNEFLIKLVESRYVVHLDFNFTELKSISYDQIINDLYKALIIDKINNCFHIFIEDNHLKIIYFTNEEINDYINAADSPKDFLQKERKGGKETKFIKNTIEKKDIIQETKDDNENKIEDKKENTIEDKKENKIEDKKENIIEDKKENKIKNIKRKDKFKETIKGQKINNNKTKEMTNQDIELQLNKMQKEINELKEKNNKMINKHKMKINSLNHQITNNTLEIYRLKSDLQLVKLRRSLKVFVNYMYIGLKLDGDFDFESKIDSIITKLNTFTSKIYDKQLLEGTQEFISNFCNKIDLGNFIAHKLDLNISILDQIFEIVDKKKKYNKVKLLLKKKTNADTIIKKLVKNRETNFLNKKLLKSEEAKINSKIPDLTQLWIKEKK